MVTINVMIYRQDGI